jgi:hypothetical protein
MKTYKFCELEMETELKKLKLSLNKIFEMFDEEIYTLSPFLFEKIGDIFGLKFGNNQILFYADNKYKVSNFDEKFAVNVKVRLNSTPKDKLQIGAWYVFTEESVSYDVGYISHYAIYLGNNKYYSVDLNSNVIISDKPHKYWHEVVLKKW